MVGAATANKELRVLSGTTVLKDMPVPVPVAPRIAVLLPMGYGAVEDLGDEDDAAADEEPRIVSDTPVLKEMPIPVPIAPRIAVLLPMGYGAVEDLGNEDDAMVGAATANEELKILSDTPVLKGMPVPASVGPRIAVLLPMSYGAAVLLRLDRMSGERPWGRKGRRQKKGKECDVETSHCVMNALKCWRDGSLSAESLLKADQGFFVRMWKRAIWAFN